MLAVLKKELKTYFLTPLGYIFIGVFLILFSYEFYILIFNTDAGYAYTFASVISSSIFLLTFVTPVLTMRMFAEEKNSGTDQLLFTSPRSIIGIVLGKFLAAGVVILITVLLFGVYFGVLEYFADPEVGVALVALLGFILVALSYVSFGMFASSIAPNQLTAAIITIGFFFISMCISTESGVFSTIALYDLYEKFFYGIIGLQEIVRLSIIYLIISSFNNDSITEKKKCKIERGNI